MARVNFADYIEHQTLVQLIKAFYTSDFAQNADKIPNQVHNLNTNQLNYSADELKTLVSEHCFALLGDTVNELHGETIADYIQKQTFHQPNEVPVLSISQKACHRCTHNQYIVTNQCQGCLKRPCTNCPFDAITYANGKAVINQEKCKKCGICMQSCPYGAIVKRTAPCIGICPVDAIFKDSNGVAVIDTDKCISCGQCTKICPYNAIMAKSQIFSVLTAIQEGKQVIAMPAPAVMGQYQSATIAQILTAFIQAGFSDAIEVAVGADITTKTEAVELAERLEQGEPFMTTSCCPAYLNAVEKHFPEMKEFISHTLTPMQYTARLLKENHPDCITVFIGPCMAKRTEGIKDDYTDYVLSNNEIRALFDALNIIPNQLTATKEDNHASKQGRSFPLTGGVAEAVISLKTCEVCPRAINGLTKEAIAKLRQYAQERKADGNLIEVMTCIGGCVGGPGVATPVKEATKEIKQIMKQSDDLILD